MCVRSFHRGSIRIDTILRVSSVSCRVWANKKSLSLAVTHTCFRSKTTPKFSNFPHFFSLPNFPQTSWKIHPSPFSNSNVRTIRFRVSFSLFFFPPKKKNFCNFSKIISGNNSNIVFSVCKKLSFFIKSRLRIKTPFHIKMTIRFSF